MSITPQSGFEFWGEFEFNIDDKGRVLVPSEFRERLKDSYVLTRGPDGAILMFPEAVWNQITTQLNSQIMQRQHGLLQRLMGGRVIVKVDSSTGRITIPKHLRDWAGITPGDTQISFVGQGPKIEIWCKTTWDKYNASFSYDPVF
ncbi:MAG: division/cell wall cluster transcriptional repressor MraZ, partial [Chthonomonadales bacterium]